MLEKEEDDDDDDDGDGDDDATMMRVLIDRDCPSEMSKNLLLLFMLMTNEC